MSEAQSTGIERDENGQYVVPNEGAGQIVQDIEAQTPDDLRQQVDNIEIKGRTECNCNFPSSEAIGVLREYNDVYKDRMDSLKGSRTNDVSKIPGYKGETLLEGHGWSNESMAFVLHCSDGVKLPLRMQLNYIKVRDQSGEEHEEYYRCFELPPANDSVDDNVIDIRRRLNDTMYVDENVPRLENTGRSDLDMAA